MQNVTAAGARAAPSKKTVEAEKRGTAVAETGKKRGEERRKREEKRRHNVPAFPLPLQFQKAKK